MHVVVSLDIIAIILMHQVMSLDIIAIILMHKVMSLDIIAIFCVCYLLYMLCNAVVALLL